MSDFIHLHNHSHYSLLDAACSVDSLVNAAKENGMPAVALTDHGVMFGAVEFYKKATRAGIKPIIGSELYVVTRGSRFDRQMADTHPEGKRHGYNHLVILARNETGYRNLMKLSTIGHTEGFYYRPRVDFDLLERHREGLIALTACRGGVVSTYLVSNDYAAAKNVARRLKEIFGDDVYLEIQNHGLPDEAVVREGMPRIARELGMKLIATNDCHYIKPEHAVAHNVLLLISDTRGTEDVRALRYGTDQVYFKSAAEMTDLFRAFPQAIESTLEVAEKCDLRLDLKTNHMPEFPIPAGASARSLDEYLEELAHGGLEKRFPERSAELRERLDYELGVIRKMGFSGYFLIVSDFITAARRRRILVGPGRGSVAGSLVAYALGITDIDPLKYDLLFERFLNPDRISMPDIDIDFQDDRREEVIAYVREKYGADSVSQIITFGTLSSRAVLKDVGRVLGVPLATVESITKQIPVVMGRVTPLREAFGLDPSAKEKGVKELEWVRDSADPKIRQLLEYSLVLEGLNRNASMHAAGVVITPGEATQYVPLYKTTSTELMTQYNMKDLEEVGLLKMDFLGLITLTVFDRTMALIRARRGVEIRLEEIPLDDPKTFELIGSGQTVGVFQFESTPMQEYLKKLKPTSVHDLAAMNALYRPGPMQFIDDFIDRKFGRQKIEYIHPKLEPILKETYGIIVYQEQVMKIASDIAGFSLAQADLMRRAMGKKNKEIMAQQKVSFIEGAGANGVPAKTAGEIFDMIDRFANYGFNKSHSVAYSVVAYQTAYFKANFAPEFMAALMTSSMGDTKQLVLFIDDCRKLGIPVLPPDVNASGVDFAVSDEGIRFGMAAIKNVGAGAVEGVVRARDAGGSFTDIFDFCARVEGRYVNKKTLESLVLAGAMDSLGADRAQMFAAIENALAFGQQRQKEAEHGQSSLFDLMDSRVERVARPALPPVPSWTRAEMLSKEKQVLGFYISGHPLDEWRQDAEALASVRLGRAEQVRDGAIVRACGIISSIRTKIDKKGRTMAFAVIEDFTGKAECLIFADAYERAAPHLAEDALVVMIGKAESSGDSIKLFPTEIYPLDEAIPQLGKSVVISLAESSLTRKLVLDVKRILQRYAGSGTCPCYFYIADGDEKPWRLSAKRILVRPDREFLAQLRALLGADHVRVSVDQ